MSERLANVHPGEVLREEFGMEAEYLAAVLMERLDMRSELAHNYAGRLLDGRSSVTDLVAEMLSRELGTTVEFWTNLQAMYDTQEEQQP